MNRNVAPGGKPHRYRLPRSPCSETWRAPSRRAAPRGRRPQQPHTRTAAHQYPSTPPARRGPASRLSPAPRRRGSRRAARPSTRHIWTPPHQSPPAHPQAHARAARKLGGSPRRRRPRHPGACMNTQPQACAPAGRAAGSGPELGHVSAHLNARTGMFVGGRGQLWAVVCGARHPSTSRGCGMRRLGHG
jgi:hypothetical protein